MNSIRTIYLDIETDGYLVDTTKVHCIATKESDSTETIAWNNQGKGKGSVEECLKYLMDSPCDVAAHNGIKFDVAALTKVYPWFSIPQHRLIDTLVMGRLMFTNLYETDGALIKRGILEQNMTGRQSVEAWGQRLGVHKIGYQGGFEAWSQEMEDYCVGDVATLQAIHKYFLTLKYSQQALNLERDVQIIVARQERRGFCFNTPEAVKLYTELARHRIALEGDLRSTFPPFYLKDGREAFTPKKDSNRYGYTAGVGVTKVKLTEFNPASRDHISKRLRTLRGWVPTEFTNDGKPKVDDNILQQLVYPEAKLLARYMMLNKRIGQLAEGDKAWLKLERQGFIYGSVITNGAVTGRMTHSHPNMGQVPATKKDKKGNLRLGMAGGYGSECRDLFMAREGYVLVGADASALELRCLAGYMSPYDDGAYIQTVINGRNDNGTDIHTVNMHALGITDRAMAKTWIYAWLYGAGDEKLGTTLGFADGAVARKAGKESRVKFITAVPAMGQLSTKVKSKVEPKITKWRHGQKHTSVNPKYVGYLKGLDGRILHCRSAHAALNTLLQSAGAVIMKQALVCLDSLLKETLSPGEDYEFVANVHDEWQIEARPEHAEHVGQMCVKAMEEAGKQLNFSCPITGEFSIGTTWKETH